MPNAFRARLRASTAHRAIIAHFMPRDPRRAIFIRSMSAPVVKPAAKPSAEAAHAQ